MSHVPQETSIRRIPVEEFAGHCRRHLQPLLDNVSCFEAIALDDEQRRQIIREPMEAVPQSLLVRLAPLRLIIVPFLEKGTASGSPGLVAFERPDTPRLLNATIFDVKDEIFVLLAAEQQEVADTHYHLYSALAGLAANAVDGREFTRFSSMVFDELGRGTRGEVDDASLQLKLKLIRRQRLPGRNTKLMRQYVRQALYDTLTLYLHGLCCDIDVEPGPQQLGTRYLRRRLEFASEIFPPNPGYNVFPDPTAERKPPPER